MPSAVRRFRIGMTKAECGQGRRLGPLFCRSVAQPGPGSVTAGCRTKERNAEAGKNGASGRMAGHYLMPVSLRAERLADITRKVSPPEL